MVIIAVMTSCMSITAQTKQNDMVLNKQQQSMVAIACLEAKGDLENLSKAIDCGLDNGLTVNQIKEALSQLYAYTGFPRSLNGLGALQKVIAEREKAGKATVEGKDADPMTKDYNALKQGTEVQTQLCGGTPFNYTFAPATDYYLKAHLFGDIFARNTLTHAERELVTVSALSGIEGVDPQLTSHVAGARNMGLSDDEIKSIPEVLASSVGITEAARCRKAIAKVFCEQIDERQFAIDNKVGIADSPYPIGNPNTGYAQYFIGNSYLAPMQAEKGRERRCHQCYLRTWMPQQLAHSSQTGASAHLRCRSRMVSGMGQACHRTETRRGYRHPCRDETLARCSERQLDAASHISYQRSGRCQQRVVRACS